MNTQGTNEEQEEEEGNDVVSFGISPRSSAVRISVRWGEQTGMKCCDSVEVKYKAGLKIHRGRRKLRDHTNNC